MSVLSPHATIDAPVARQARWGAARWAVVALGVVSAGLVLGSYFFDWWRFWLYAPQYPGGLRLAISLTGVTGDVREVEILNHYIGMQSLDNAAPTERGLALHGVSAIAAFSLFGAVFANKRWSKFIAVPAALFPIVFVADAHYWLYRFGNELDPRAPLEIPGFTPQLFGNGEIGQFATFAAPAMGFWLAVAGFVAIAAGAVIRHRICDGCGRLGRCAAACPHEKALVDRKPT